MNAVVELREDVRVAVDAPPVHEKDAHLRWGRRTIVKVQSRFSISIIIQTGIKAHCRRPWAGQDPFW